MAVTKQQEINKWRDECHRHWLTVRKLTCKVREWRGVGLCPFYADRDCTHVMNDGSRCAEDDCPLCWRPK